MHKLTDLLHQFEDVITRQKQLVEYVPRIVGRIQFLHAYVDISTVCSSVDHGRDRIAKEQQALKDLAAQEHQMRKQIAIAQESLTRLTKQMVCV